MAGSYVCMNCRSRLLRRAIRLSPPQWHTRAAFISLANVKPLPNNSKVSPSDENTPRTSDSDRKVAAETSLERSNGNDSAFDDHFPWLPAQNAPYRGRYSKHLQGPKADESELVEEAIDETIQLSNNAGQRTGALQNSRAHGRGFYKHLKIHEADGAKDTEEVTAETRLPSDNSERTEVPDNRIPIRKVDNGGASYLMRALDNPGKTLHSWNYFLDKFGSKDSPALVKPMFQDLGPLSNGKVFRRLLNAVIMAWCVNSGPIRYPMPSQVVQKFLEVQIMRQEFWTDAIWLLVSQILTQLASGRSDIRNTERLTLELMELWQLLFLHFSGRTRPKGITKAWNWLPATFPVDPLTRRFGSRLQKWIPMLPRSELDSVGLAALVTFNLFIAQAANIIIPQNQNIGLSRDQRSEHLPFMKLMAHILPGVDLEDVIRAAEIRISTITLPEEYASEVIRQLKAAPSQAIGVIGARKFALANPSAIQDPQQMKELDSFFANRLNRAVGQEDPKMVEKVWEDARHVFVRSSPSLATAITSSFYDKLLTAFMSLRQFDRAVDVWNEMISSGRKPTSDTWAAMLLGCLKSRDAQALEQTWERMLASGIQPDLQLWNFRIGGLISLGRPRQGLEALNDMGQAWLDAEKAMKAKMTKKRKGSDPATQSPTTVSVPKPTIETINAVLTAFVRFRRLSLHERQHNINRVLTWAGRFSIRADAHTYNVMIGLALEGEDYTTANDLLKQMHQENVVPDIATFTIILNAAMKNASWAQLSESEQSSAIISLLDSLEKVHGVKLNRITYAGVIHTLLSQHNNFTAARAVLDHMTSRQIWPSPQIFTTLITNYFRADPPNIPAVDSLLAQVIQIGKGVTDHIFYDRMIEGYARCGEIGKMMTVLARMSKEGKNPGWGALTAVLRALTEIRDWTRARQIVSEVSNMETVARPFGAYRQSDFWALVEELGLEDSIEWHDSQRQSTQAVHDLS
ncbi:hypothetical protein K432DRAFT_382835 [Lepidopterella palustris CBS 459.81]|uniref:Pentatricopeptide repeat protein n=1 Tax=Lepidopterella palustris CBS 459.81 TaxID=1314670 RepID=A0A8E2JEH7_9PEZI|nr:hypothetical protein K432DRAFT_382835 [Lepidopterella palustris CBS 459.81]